jgi:thiol-disulfide isomerase/thioredoxin
MSRWVLLGVAVVVVAAGGLYLFMSGDDDEPADDNGGPFSGNPITDVLGTPQPGTGPVGPERPEVGADAPDFVLRDVVDGETLRSLSDYEGTPVVLNWYASWCGPCKRELPLFQEASVALEGEVTFLAVNLFEPQERALSILEELGVTFPAVLDSSGAVTDRWRVSLMPHTFFINAEGVLVSQQVGEVTEDVLETRLGDMGVTYSPSQ